MANKFFPYKYYDEALTIEMNDLLIDKENNNYLIDNERKCLNLFSLKDWKEIDCKLVVRVPENLPQKISTAQNNDDWKAILLIRSIAGSGLQIGWRRKVPLKPIDESKLLWEGKIKVLKSEEGHWSELQAYLTREKNIQSSEKNIACLQGQKLASSATWSINIDERTSPLGKSLRVEWINFPEDQRFEKFPLNVYYIDFSEDIPVLYLNEAIDDLKVVLNSKGYIGARSAVRESIFRSIAQPVWLSLILVALQDHYADEEDRPEWQKSVIYQYASLVSPDEADLSSAVQELIRLRDKPALLLPKLTAAIQSSIEIDRSTTRLLNSIIQK